MISAEQERLMQRCFQKEREALIKDIESLRIQLQKKDYQIKGLKNNLNEQSAQSKQKNQILLQDLKNLQKEYSHAKKELEEANHLLEASFDQHIENQTKMQEKKSELRNIQKKTQNRIDYTYREVRQKLENQEKEKKHLEETIQRLRIQLNDSNMEWNKTKLIMQTAIDDLKQNLTVSQQINVETEARNDTLLSRYNRLEMEHIKCLEKLSLTSLANETVDKQLLQSRNQYKEQYDHLVLDYIKLEANFSQLKEHKHMIQEDYLSFHSVRPINFQLIKQSSPSKKLQLQSSKQLTRNSSSTSPMKQISNTSSTTMELIPVNKKTKVIELVPSHEKSTQTEKNRSKKLIDTIFLETCTPINFSLKYHPNTKPFQGKIESNPWPSLDSTKPRYDPAHVLILQEALQDYMQQCFELQSNIERLQDEVESHTIMNEILMKEKDELRNDLLKEKKERKNVELINLEKCRLKELKEDLKKEREGLEKYKQKEKIEASLHKREKMRVKELQEELEKEREEHRISKVKERKNASSLKKEKIKLKETKEELSKELEQHKKCQLLIDSLSQDLNLMRNINDEQLKKIHSLENENLHTPDISLDLKKMEEENIDLKRRYHECLNSLDNYIQKKQTFSEKPKELKDDTKIIEENLNLKRRYKESLETIEKLIEHKDKIWAEFGSLPLSIENDLNNKVNLNQSINLQVIMVILFISLQFVENIKNFMVKSENQGSELVIAKDIYNAVSKNGSIISIQAECDALKDKLHATKIWHEEEIQRISQQMEDRKTQMQIYIDGVRSEKESLFQKIQDHAITIHELSINDPIVLDSPETGIYFPLAPSQSSIPSPKNRSEPLTME